MITNPKVELILNLLDKAGHRAYLVGGFVRNVIMGCDGGTDCDITTSAKPDEVTALFEAEGYPVFPTGLKHGTVTVRIEHEDFEITTFRTEGAYSDGRHPDSVTFVSDVRDDLSRRDFTMNAVAWNPSSGYTDPFGGIDDIEKHVIRCVGDPFERFTEDALRIMRALRFSSVFGYEIENETSEAIHSCRNLLKNIAVERIQVELMKLLCGREPKRILMEYHDVLEVFIPEIAPCIGCLQHNPYHIYDVWEHTAVAVQSAPPIPELRLCLLFHDIGKPACYTQDIKSDGSIRGHFYGHERESARMAGEIMRRLRFSNEMTDTVVTIIGAHCTPVGLTEKSIKKMLSRLGEERFRMLILHHKADNSAQTPSVRDERLPYWDKVSEITDKIIAEKQCFSAKDLAVSGYDLIKLGIPQGPVYKEIMDELLAKVISGELQNDKEILLKAAEAVASKSP